MTASRRGYYGWARPTLCKVVAGPEEVEIDFLSGIPTDENDYFSGWRVLHLERFCHRFSPDTRHEALSVYANWGASQRPCHPVAVLRAACWTRAYLRELGAEPGESTPVPARLVWMPLHRAQEWIDRISELRVMVGEPDPGDAPEPEETRRLLVDLGWIERRFDKRWRSDSAGHEELNQEWTRLWTEMNEIVRTSIPRDPLRATEHFSSDNPPFHYDHAAFDRQTSVK